MKNRIFLITMIAVLAAVTFGFTSCVGGHKMKAGDKDDLHEFILFKLQKELTLTDDQVESLKEIGAEMKAKKEELHNNDGEKHEKIKELITSDYLSEADILTLIESHTPQVEEMKIFLAQKIAQVHALLTPEQRIALVKLLENFANNGHIMGKGFHH